MRKCLALLPLLLIIFTSCQTRVPKEFPTISTEQLHRGIQDKSLRVFDNNNPEVYREGHIPTATFMDIYDPSSDVLPADQGASLVFYCKNTRCGASEKGAGIAWEKGYRNIRVYKLGIDGWKKAGMAVESGG